MNCNSQNAIFKNCKSQNSMHLTHKLQLAYLSILLYISSSCRPNCGPEKAVFPHSPVRLHPIAPSQSNLQFPFSKAIAIQIYFRQLTLVCQFKLFNIGLNSVESNLSFSKKLSFLLQTHTEQSRHTYKAHTYTLNIIITLFAHDSKLQYKITIIQTIQLNVSTSGVENTIALIWLVPQHKVHNYKIYTG